MAVTRGEMRSLYYRKDGTPYPEGEAGLLEWAKDFENTKARRIGNDILPNGIRVSTVWMGLDHRWDGGRPHIFESVVFGVPGDSNDDEMWRYSTEEEARLGHKMLVKKWSAYKSAEQILSKD